LAIISFSDNSLSLGIIGLVAFGFLLTSLRHIYL
jgi:hypothetical protein